MTDGDTTPPFDATLPPQVRAESHIMNISIRGLLCMALVGTVCWQSVQASKVEEPLYSMAIAALSYYFGQRERPKAQTNV